MSSDEFPADGSTRADAAPEQPEHQAPRRTAVLSTPYGQSTGLRRPAPGTQGPQGSSTDPAQSPTGPAAPDPGPEPGQAADLATPVRLAAGATSMSAATPQEPPLHASDSAEPEGTADDAAEGQPATRAVPSIVEPAPQGPAPTAAPRSRILDGPLQEVMDEAGADEADDGANEGAEEATAGALPGGPPQGSGPPEGDDGPLYDAGPRRRRWPLWAAAASFLLLAGMGAGGYAYASHYEDRAVPGTSVAGTDVAGRSREEIVELIEDRAQGATVSISGDVQATASLADLGTTVDAQATADAVMARGESVVSRFEALLGEQSVPVVLSTNEQAAADYAVSLIPSDRAKAINATVVLGEDGQTFSATSSSSGTSLDSGAMAAAAKEAAGSLSPASVKVSFGTSEPAVSQADAQKVADQANSWVAQEVTITVPASSDQEEASYTADAAEKASWITLTTSVDAAPALSVDAGRVSQWVTAQAQEANAEPVNGKRNVTTKGTVVATPLEAEDGRTVDNAETVATDIVTSLGQGRAYTGSFETTVVEATWDERTIADGAEKLVYQAAPGEKWIDVNLANYTVTAYEGATVVYGPVTMVDGAKETPTVTGTYQVYLQYPSQTMEGDNVDGTRYRTEDVPWVTYFYSGYAFHGAPWRSDFGYSASHGCVNMPSSDAQWIYNWVEIGTTVVSH
ncbi:L,D-transpeptidase [Actinomyces bowdenii]|nr:L,D-transpeptidase [Actinomyces bowdenii]